jgi:hypothetical protein
MVILFNIICGLNLGFEYIQNNDEEEEEAYILDLLLFRFIFVILPKE